MTIYVQGTKTGAKIAQQAHNTQWSVEIETNNLEYIISELKIILAKQTKQTVSED